MNPWMLLFWIFFFSIGVPLIFHFLTRKFVNPFKLTLVVGKKGSGKTTWMVQLIYKYLKRGYTVYANINIPGVYYFDPMDIGKFTFPPKSVVFIDEVNIYWDNRKWKDIALCVIEWFRYQRQYKILMFLFTQTFDIDKKLRSLCDDLYLVRNVLRIFAWCKRIRKWPDLKQAEGENEASIVDMIAYDWFILWPFGSRHFVYIPKWSKYFASYNPPPLDLIPSRYILDPDRTPKWLIRKFNKSKRRKLWQILRVSIWRPLKKIMVNIRRLLGTIKR